MPAYEYRCHECNHDFTVFLTLQQFESKPRLHCPRCQSDHCKRKYGTFFAKTVRKS